MDEFIQCMFVQVRNSKILHRARPLGFAGPERPNEMGQEVP